MHYKSAVQNTRRRYLSDYDSKSMTALLQHYKSNHNLLLARRPNLSQCFSVIFVEEPPFDVLDICEDKWFHKLGASINLQTMILPAIK